MAVQVYVDMMSQPSRAVVWFCLYNNIPHEVKLTPLGKNAHLTPEYVKLNPHKKVPTILDGEFAVNESHSIMRYLSEAYEKRQLYPADLKQRTRIDQYLDWHHTNLRIYASGFFRLKYLGPRMGGSEPAPERVEKARKDLNSQLKVLDTIFLGKNSFIAGSEISIADLSAFCELRQLELADVKWDGDEYPRLKEWAERMRKVPHQKTVHEVLEKLLSKAKANL